MHHIMIVNRLAANKERFRPEGFDQIRPHSNRSLQFYQKVRPLSFRAEKFDQFTATLSENCRREVGITFLLPMGGRSPSD